MKALRRGWKRLLGSLSSEKEDLSDEIRSHIEMQTDDNLRAGMPPEEARRQAKLKFGGLDSTKESYRDQRGLPWLETAFADFRYAARALRKSPSFTIVAVLTLAVGIGANTAIFSLVNQVLLHPPGISQPERIVVLRTKYDKLKLNFEVAAPPALDAMRNRKEVFEHAAALQGRSFNYGGQQVPERLLGGAVSAEWFDVFGARPKLGRVFTPEEDQPSANRVVVLAHAAWLRLFGGDPKVIGRSIELNQQPYQVIGVMNRDFRWPTSVDLWVPLALPPRAFTPQNWFNENLWIAARIRPGVPPTQADVFLKTLTNRVLEQAPPEAKRDISEAGWGLLTMPFRDSRAGVAKTPVLILLGAVGMVLLIACSNIAGLMLARTSVRARELAVRAALGATRVRLMRAVLAESLLLSVTGGAVGIAMAQAAAGLLLRLAPESAAAGLEPLLDGYVLWFAVAASLVSAAFFGLVPAWQLSKVDPQQRLRSGARTFAGGVRQRLRSGLVVAEAALALVLLVMTGLFLRSLARLQETNPGFEPRGVMTASFSLPTQAYADGKAQAVFIRSVLERLGRVNGVTAATVGEPIPFSNEFEGGSFQIVARTVVQGEPGPHAERRWVTPDYLKTFGIPLKEGRFFTDLDRLGTEPVAVIDERLARRYWPNENPLDKRVEPTSGEGKLRIVGVVGHVMQSDLASDEDEGVLYASILQHPMPLGSIAVKTSGDVGALAAVIRDAVRETDAGLPLFNLKSMDTMIGNSLAPRRFLLRLLGFFAAAALFLAALGLYGVISYSVAQRTREIGIRIALGAERLSVLKLVVGQGFVLAAIGVVIGIAAAALTGRFLESQLFQVSAFDPLTIFVTAGALLMAGLVASYLPARRAVRVDPAVTLRCD
ncbi:MAG: efflux pump, inner rane subunit [Bryobacterales bacterium]|nr:efflux pump, inner rane subunit [Bryobacterales bacterium]